MSIAQDPYEQNSEIDMRELLAVIAKRKKSVLSICIASILLTAAWNLLTPRIYEVSTIIEPPITAITDTGMQNFDSVANIKARIDSGTHNEEIINALNLREKTLHFATSLTKDTGIIKVNLKRPENETGSGKTILAKLLEMLNRDYAQTLASKWDRIENQIKMVLSQISTKESEIKLNNERYKILADRERQLIEEIKEIRANSERLLADRNALLGRKENTDAVSSLLYSVTIQQNMSYFTQLQNDLSTLRGNKENTLNAIDNLKNGINESKINISNLNLLKDGVQNIRVIQEPRVSPLPIGPKRRQNVLIAGILGLIVGLSSAFLIEYGESSPRRL